MCWSNNNKETIKIGFLNGDPLYLQGLAGLLGRQRDFHVLDGGGSSADVREGMTEVVPDVAVLINGTRDLFAEETLVAIIEELPGSRVLILTECEDLCTIWRMLVLGARACLAKNVHLEELVSTIRAIYRDPGRFVLSVGRGALRQWEPSGEMEGVLTGRERQILELVATGSTNSEIAKELFIAEATVKRHLSNTYAKLGVSSRFAAMVRAAELGILPRSDRPPEAVSGRPVLALSRRDEVRGDGGCVMGARR